MTIDNCLEALLPLENNKKRKMRNRMKKKIIDYQTNKEETTDWKICGQLSRDNCQLTKCPLYYRVRQGSTGTLGSWNGLEYGTDFEYSFYSGGDFYALV